jgi:hypothetical protein
MIRPSAGRTKMLTDGPYVEGKEHLGGFTIVRVPRYSGGSTAGRWRCSPWSISPITSCIRSAPICRAAWAALPLPRQAYDAAITRTDNTAERAFLQRRRAALVGNSVW